MDVRELIAKSWQQPLVVGHRGAAAVAPENTIEAFKAGMAAGADALECDIHLSRDNVPMVIHDSTVDRTTQGTGKVRDHTAEELHRLGIPTLDELLDLTHNQIALIIEMKDSDGIEAEIVSRINVRKMEEQVIIFSFYPKRLKLSHELAPRLYQAYLSSKAPSDPKATLSEVDSRALAIQYQVVTDKLAAVLRVDRIPLFVWTVPPGETCEHYFSLPANFIITDDPHSVVKQRDGIDKT